MQIQANHFFRESMRLPVLKEDGRQREEKREKKEEQGFLIAEKEKANLLQQECDKKYLRSEKIHILFQWTYLQENCLLKNAHQE